MNLSKYFQTSQGSGMLATSNSKGAVDIAVYSKPHVLGRNKIAFVMKDRLSHRNLKSNPKAAYSFILKDKPADGLRLYLKKTGEETDQAVVFSMRKRTKPPKKGEKLFLVYFRVTKARALIGNAEFKLT